MLTQPHPSCLFLPLILNVTAGNSLPTQRKLGTPGHSMGWVNSPPGERLCPCKGFSGLGTDKLSHWRMRKCACTHTEPAKASGTFATILLIIIRAELYSLRSLTCFAALKALLQPAQPWTVFGLRADSQPAGRGSGLSDTERCRTARLYSLAFWEHGATPASISQEGAGGPKDRVSRKKPGEFSLGDNQVTWTSWFQEHGFRTEEQSGEMGWCKETLCFQWKCSEHTKSQPQILWDSCIQKRFPKVFA